MSLHDLQKITDGILIENNPKLRAAIRAALDKGAKPADIRRRYGLTAKRKSLTACAVDAIVDEWLAELF